MFLRFSHLILIFFISTTFTAKATVQITGTIFFEDKSFKLEKPLLLPKDEATANLYRKNFGCTAGSPQGVWHIKNGRLFLTGIASCSGYSLQAVYGENKPIPATWITDSFTALGDERICGIFRYHPEALPKHTLVGRIENGIVIELQKNTRIIDPRVATLDEIKKIYEDEPITPDQAVCLPYPRPPDFLKE